MPFGFICFIEYIFFCSLLMIVLCMLVLSPSVAEQWKIQHDFYIRLKLVNYNDDFVHTLDKCLALAIAYQINRLRIKIKDQRK